MRVYQCKKEGSGLVGNIFGTVINKSIDLLPVELHLPGYQYCGLGTNLAKRLHGGDPGLINLTLLVNRTISHTQNIQI